MIIKKNIIEGVRNLGRSIGLQYLRLPVAMQWILGVAGMAGGISAIVVPIVKASEAKHRAELAMIIDRVNANTNHVIGVVNDSNLNAIAAVSSSVSSNLEGVKTAVGSQVNEIKNNLQGVKASVNSLGSMSIKIQNLKSDVTQQFADITSKLDETANEIEVKTQELQLSMLDEIGKQQADLKDKVENIPHMILDVVQGERTRTEERTSEALATAFEQVKDYQTERIDSKLHNFEESNSAQLDQLYDFVNNKVMTLGNTMNQLNKNLTEIKTKLNMPVKPVAMIQSCKYERTGGTRSQWSHTCTQTAS